MYNGREVQKQELNRKETDNQNGEVILKEKHWPHHRKTVAEDIAHGEDGGRRGKCL